MYKEAQQDVMLATSEYLWCDRESVSLCAEESVGSAVSAISPVGFNVWEPVAGGSVIEMKVGIEDGASVRNDRIAGDLVGSAVVTSVTRLAEGGCVGQSDGDADDNEG